MSNSMLYKQKGRIAFLLSFLTVVLLCGVALKVQHSHPDSKRVLFAVGYGLVLLGVFWTRALDRRLRDAGLPRWSFWPYFLIVFTGSLAAHLLKFTNSLETLGLFLVLQLPALLFPAKAAPAEPLVPSAASHEDAARPITRIGAIEFAVYVLLIAGSLFVLHLLKGDMAGLALPRALRYAFDAASILLCVLWVLCVRGRLKALGLARWVPVSCAVVLIASAVPFALHIVSFQHALVLFAVLQLPAVLLRRKIVSAGLVHPDASEEVDSDS